MYLHCRSRLREDFWKTSIVAKTNERKFTSFSLFAKIKKGHFCFKFYRQKAIFSGIEKQYSCYFPNFVHYISEYRYRTGELRKRSDYQILC
jgi:hypothetical protein